MNKHLALAALVIAALALSGTAQATVLYWDCNGIAAGFGDANVGTWGSDSFWTADSTGLFSDTPGTATTTSADVVRINAGSFAGFAMSVSGDVHALTLLSAATAGATTTTINNDGGGTIHLYGVGIATPAYNGAGGNSPIVINAPIVLEQAADSIVYLGTMGGNQGSTTIAGGVTSTNSVNLYFGRMHSTTVSGSLNITGTVTCVVPYNNKNEYGVTISADIGSNVTNVEQKSETGRLMILSGTNSYTGTATATSGILWATKASALPGYDSAARVVFNGGMLAVPVGGASDWTTGQVDTLLSNATKTGGTLGIDTGAGDLTQWIAFTTSNLGSVGLTKRGDNVLTLDQANTYTGVTAVGGGVLRANNGTGLPTLSPLMINDGVLETSIDLVRAAGTAVGQMALDGKLQTPRLGFSAKGGPVRVCFGTLAAPTILTWGTSTSKDYTGPFNTGSGGAFVLNATTADNTLEFMNPISLGTTVKTVQVDASVATMSGILSSGAGGGLTKTGNGTLVLLPAYPSSTNTYSGPTTIEGGALRAAQGTGLPNASYLKLNGGVYETSGAFTRVNSTTVNGANFNWSGNNGGGFSANGGKLTVTIGNNAATEQVWVTANTNNGIRGTLKFGSATANAETEFQNNIDLGDGTRTINVAAGAGGDFATISGVIRNSAGTGSLTKTGGGRLVLTGANTYNGTTTVSGGTLAYGASNTIYTGPVTVNGASAVLAMGSYIDEVGLVTLTAGNITGSGTLTSTAGFTMNNAGTTSASAILAGAVGLTKTGAGTLALTGPNTYDGVTTLSAGILNLGVAEIAGTSGPLGKPATDANSIVMGGGTLQYSDVNQNDYSGRFSTDAGQAYKVDTNSQTVTWATALTSLGGTLTKSGAGTQTLTGANTYTGATTVSGGTLALTGAYTNNIASSPTIRVDDGALLNVTGLSGGTITLAGQRLQGAGTVTGSVIAPSGAVVAPSPVVGGLDIVGDVQMNAGSTYEWALDANTGAALVDITGALTLDTGWKLKLVGSGTPTAKEKYDLFTYTGSFSGDIAGIIDDTGVTGWPTPSIIGQDTGRIYVVFGVLPGDTNEDGVVDAVDYIAIKTNFGLSGTGITRLQGDLIDNDIVDWADLQELMDQFGTRSVGGAPAVPEPATLGLLAIGALAVLRRRRT